MTRKFVDQKPGEVLTLSDGTMRPFYAVNRLLKKKGLVLRWRGHPIMGDQVFLRLEELSQEKDQKQPRGFSHSVFTIDN